jgi:hypothetical protein
MATKALKMFILSWVQWPMTLISATEVEVRRISMKAAWAKS